MRIYLKTTLSKEIIPFNYQSFLTGAIHKWIGKNNNIHGGLSLLSFSWLQNISTMDKIGLKTTPDSYFFISAYDESIIKAIVKGINEKPEVCFGMSVSEIHMKDAPNFGNEQIFMNGSPIFIKRRIDNNEKHITYENPQSDIFLTETLKRKLLSAQMSNDDVIVSFDRNFLSAKTKIVKYKDISNKVNICPVIIKGTPEQIAFAWDVGLGNSTGIGFGSLK